MLDHVVDPNMRASLKRSLEMFIEYDLCRGMPIWLAEEWNRSSNLYNNKAAQIMKMTCSASQGPVEWGGELIFTVNAGETFQAQWSEYLSGTFPTILKDRLSNRAHGVKTLWVYILLKWQGVRIGHAVIMAFDMKRKLQILYDPHGGYRNIESASYHLCKHQFHPDFTPVPPKLCFPRLQSQSLQSKVETIMDASEHGVCGILSTLVMICCIRFGYNNPLDVANMIIPNMSNESKQIGNKLISWYSQISTIDNDALFAKLVFPPSEEGRCSVYSSLSNRICSRGSCRNNGNLCWQHRHIIMNRMAPNKKCATAQSSCSISE